MCHSGKLEQMLCAHYAWRGFALTKNEILILIQGFSTLRFGVHEKAYAKTIKSANRKAEFVEIKKLKRYFLFPRIPLYDLHFLWFSHTLSHAHQIVKWKILVLE